ncbi:neprilysin-1-like [Dermacentor silvarum]|uniref:neprilysin-1-like n=1 Tax=Dermacentor silvarum TaxID=543639 RepID=UPI00210175D4|nr:neprilysin-1-like [Dermacentor silvarum]
MEHTSVSSETGQQVPKPPRAEQCVGFVHSAMKEVTTFMYVKEYVPPEAKKEIEEIVERLKAAFLKALNNAQWMDYETRRNAKEKVMQITAKIAYPRWLLDPQVLESIYSDVSDLDPKSSFVKMMHDIRVNNEKKLMQKFRQPYSKDLDWLLSQSAATAFYSPSGNEIVYPAGGLRAPFYEHGLPKSVNFGSIGSVIAHEISHSFIGRGGFYGADGRQKLWWTQQSQKNFSDRTDCFKQQYEQVFDKEANINLNGQSTLDENVADNIGLMIAFEAYSSLLNECKRPAAKLETLEQLSSTELFLVSYAMVWCEVTNADQVKSKIQRNRHSPNKYRVNIPAANLAAFASTFNCGSTDSENSYSKNKCILF